jgi:hypothetical protein
MELEYIGKRYVTDRNGEPVEDPDNVSLRAATDYGYGKRIKHDRDPLGAVAYVLRELGSLAGRISKLY